jgi:hypothetical protein
MPRLAKGLALPAGVRSWAKYSPCGRYRYALGRELDNPPADAAHTKVVLFVMLNPSCATEHVDDRTLAACWAFTRAWGGTEMRVANVYALRATDPKDLWLCDDPVGRDRDTWLRAMIYGWDTGTTLPHQGHPAHTIVCGWGQHAKAWDLRGVKALLRERKAVYALHVNADGSPKHPLYVARSTPLQEYTP